MATDASATIAVPEINSSTPTLITINATAQLPVKLTPTNYPSWRAQFNALLYGYDLMGYVDGSSLCPSTTQPVLRTFWIRQDQLLLHAILASVSPQVISLIASAKTSKEAWDKLLRLFASKARARVLGLKERLTLLRRENKSVSEYLQEVRVIADELAIIDVPLSDDDLLLYILNGVGSDFKEIAAVVRSRDTSISFENLHDKLVEHEAALKRDDTVVAAPVITANVTQTSRSHTSNRGYRSNNSNSNRGSFASRNPSRGSFGHPHTSSIDNNSRGSNGPTQPAFTDNSRRSTHMNSTGYRGFCQWCGIQGHSAKRCPQLQYGSHSQPVANPTSHGRSTSSPTWLLDSGASHHVTSNVNTLSGASPYDGPDEIIIGNGSGLGITHVGSTTVPSSSSQSFTLSNVLCVPSMQKDIISISKFNKQNNTSIELFPDFFHVKDLSTGAVLLRGPNKDDVYEWSPQSFYQPQALVGVVVSPNLWHRRLGHPSHKILQQVLRLSSINVSSKLSESVCHSCLCNKSHRLPFGTSSLTSHGPLDLLYSDVWGPAPYSSIDGFSYYVIFVDHFTKYIWLYPLKKKSDVFSTFVTFKALVENYFKRKITRLYTDGGGEFIKLQHFLSSNGITHLLTPPHTPQHNGVAERRHRHIVETGLTLLHQASLPLTYWSYAFKTAAYLINRMPTPLLHNLSPFTQLFDEQPNYSRLRTFGCLCFPWLRPYNSNKLLPRSRPCLFLGYSPNQSAFQCLDLSSNKLFISRHVQFDESTFPLANLPSSIPHVTVDNSHTWVSSLPPVTYVPVHSPTMPVAPVVSSSMPSHVTSSSSSASAPVSEPSPSVALAPIAPLLPSSNPQASVPTSTAPIITPPVHYPAQNDPAQPPPHLSPIRTYTRNPNRTVVTFPSSDPHPSNPPIPPVHPDHSMVTRAKAGIHKPNPRYAMTATTHPILSSIEPTCVSQAVKDPLWRQAMSNEFNALIRNGTWELIPSLPSQNLIGCKWVFRIKRHPDGTIDRYKARLVAKGFHQRPGVDFSDTFSPVVKPTTIRIVLHLAVTHGWPIRQLDVNNAFLHGTLLENVYMVQPPGFVDSNHPSYVCKLRKALYGLKQAPRAWYKELHSFLLSHGFVNAISDASLFLFKNGTTVIYFLVSVDDLLITGNNSTLVAKFIQLLATRFSVKDLGSLHYFLGVEVLPTATGLFLSQQKYIHDLLVNAKMDGAKAVSTPLSTTDSLMLHDGSPLTDPTPYRRLVGGLQYLSLTRPDISFAVNKLSQFMHSPSETHWQALKRLLRYLKGTISFGLHLCRRPSNRLYAFSDADWAGDHDDRKSTTGYVVYLGGNLISWSSRKQQSVSRSSTEAEYRAIAATTSELTWIQSLLRELGIPLPTPPVVSCDNIGAMFYCANPVLHSRMKHIEIDFQFVRDRVTRGLLQVSHVSTTDQLADALTKPLPRPRFHLLRSKIGVSDGATVLRGRIREPPTSKEISSSPTQSAPSIDSVN
ncbi:hypothetical protein L3X38_028172 [Prunus dulcis]|uniref:Integrase catalytic domain-containing protein n=1 Tax=Prunus dulcis TaxID=3755 RepID=A0AAD4VP90_PRUDU|nr:hypothetical protein L3X38_028172 [Prunus dulcis]